MNRGHAVGCPALRAGVPCVCWEIQDQAGRVRELEEENRALDIEWHGLQGLAGDQRLEIIRLEADIARTGEPSPQD